MTELQLGYTASPCKVHRCEDEHNQPWTERGATTGVDCPLLPVSSSTRLSPLPCHPAYLWFCAQKGLEVGKGARARQDWGSSDQEEAMLIHPLPLVLPRSWDSKRTWPCQLLSPLLVAYHSRGFPTSSSCHCLSLHSQNICSFLTPGNFNFLPSFQLLLSKSYYRSETGSQYEQWGLQTNTFSTLRNSLLPQGQSTGQMAPHSTWLEK